jgi:hypothetical protein
LGAPSEVAPVAPQIVDAQIFSPRQIGTLTFLLGYSAGIVLSSINWIRMGMADTVAVHSAAGIILLFVRGFTLSQKTSCGGILGLMLQAIVSFYLYNQMKTCIQRFTQDGNTIRSATWKSGILVEFLALCATILLLAVVLMIILHFE